MHTNCIVVWMFVSSHEEKQHVRNIILKKNYSAVQIENKIFVLVLYVAKWLTSHAVASGTDNSINVLYIIYASNRGVCEKTQ